jgi:hypothetical protein
MRPEATSVRGLQLPNTASSDFPFKCGTLDLHGFLFLFFSGRKSRLARILVLWMSEAELVAACLWAQSRLSVSNPSLPSHQIELLLHTTLKTVKWKRKETNKTSTLPSSPTHSPALHLVCASLSPFPALGLSPSQRRQPYRHILPSSRLIRCNLVKTSDLWFWKWNKIVRVGKRKNKRWPRMTWKRKTLKFCDSCNFQGKKGFEKKALLFVETWSPSVRQSLSLSLFKHSPDHYWSC